MKAIVVGCGKVGACLATYLAGEGYQVAIVDRNPKAFKALKSEAQNGTAMGKPQAPEGRIRCVLGVGIDEDVLREAGIEEADAFAAVTESDYANIMAGLIAKEIFRVPKVIVRVSEPKRERIFRELGLEIICPTMLGARGILDLFTKG